jgi:hypothetical protein
VLEETQNSKLKTQNLFRVNLVNNLKNVNIKNLMFTVFTM